MRNYVVAGLTAELMMTMALIATAPPASAGCVPYVRQTLLCDGPIQPDGSWQRCLPLPDTPYDGLRCWLLGPGHAQPWQIYTNPPLPVDHIDP